jgi:ribosomal protein S18 acetylase RimI-like enzyme
MHGPAEHGTSPHNRGMNTLLRPMTEAGFARWFEHSVARYADENVAAGRWPADGALARADEGCRRLLPGGLATPGQQLFTVHEAAEGAPAGAEAGVEVGVLWLAVTEHPGGRSGYVYEIEIWPAHRRRGHARGAFLALEALAREQGLADIGLHVFAHNHGAQALYRALGYEPTGINMQKRLPPGAAKP